MTTGQPTSSGHLRTTITRTDAGRKLDTWTYHAPDAIGKISVKVTVHGGTRGNMEFKAKSLHPLLKGKSWTATDLNLLSRQVETDIKDAVTDQLSADWVPGFYIHTSNSEDPAGIRAGLSVSIKHIRINKGAPAGNQGQRDVIWSSGSRTVINERDHRDQLDLGEGLAKELRARQNEGDSIVLVEDTSNSQDRLDALKTTLSVFSTALMEHMSPRNPGEVIPTPDELVEMMRRAAETAKQGSSK